MALVGLVVCLVAAVITGAQAYDSHAASNADEDLQVRKHQKLLFELPRAYSYVYSHFMSLSWDSWAAVQFLTFPRIFVSVHLISRGRGFVGTYAEKGGEGKRRGAGESDCGSQQQPR